VDKEGEKIKKIEGHGRRMGVEYGYVLLFTARFVFADALNFSDLSPRECERYE
jgi:hypothetical protein